MKQQTINATVENLMTAIELAIEIEKRTGIKVLFQMQRSQRLPRMPKVKLPMPLPYANEPLPGTEDLSKKLSSGMVRHWKSVRRYAKKNNVPILEARRILKQEHEEFASGVRK